MTVSSFRFQRCIETFSEKSRSKSRGGRGQAVVCAPAAVGGVAQWHDGGKGGKPLGGAAAERRWSENVKNIWPNKTQATSAGDPVVLRSCHYLYLVLR